MIYFDNAATTMPLNNSYEPYYNPSSPHKLGILTERALRNARVKIAIILKCNPDELIFTSGGTEANNIAILGYTLAKTRQGVSLLCLPYEHPSVIAPMKFAQERGWASYDTLNLNNIPDGNLLISISHVNHETGDKININDIASYIKKKNPYAIIHVDGAQGFCKETLNLNNIDMYSFSGHKCHSPTGVGGLWIRKGLRIVPIIYGGGQENGLRAGTENVNGIAQMSDAVEILNKNIASYHLHVCNIREVLLQIQSTLPNVTVNSLKMHSSDDIKNRIYDSSPYIINMSFLGIKGEVLVHALSDKGVHVSMGAACHKHKRGKSSLESMGFGTNIAESAVRFSFSAYNTLLEAERACDIIINEVKRLRKII